ncbi:MAG: tetratricopeptide repeat protein [Maricaulis sp.]|uniref:tetratricopeptide repeat protein n=1 Tax=Maricaulis sp. TaxID=1486257 RepID=UPI00261D0980|nr:tetratricopeptide repeat protein [Maricaulis sp.]MDM7984783.1 tetratricopeptide repeat protein [Maricaulis sp.]
MTRFDGFDLAKFTRSASMIVLAGVLFGTAVSDADAQRRNRRDAEQSEEDAAERVFSAAIGEIVLVAQEQQGLELFAESIETLNRALNTSGINPYERSIVLQMRGRAYYEQEQVQRAITDWETAITTGAMLTSEIANLRINIGQLYITEGQYDQGINTLEAAIRDAGPDIVTAPLARMLSQAYAQAERYQDGLRWAEAFWELHPYADRSRGDYSLMLFYYQQLDMIPQQMEIVEAMVARWPDEKRNWTSYASLLAQTNRETDAFEANKIMYINGMLTESAEIERVSQYYSYFEYPYRGAAILEREMNAGRVDRDQGNLQLLANMWRQAREWERAIPVLRQLAQLTGDGDDWVKLAEALYQEDQLSEAETAFQEALNRGGINRPGDTWNLLGTVRYELGRRQSAIAAFQEGARFPYARRTANGWATFIRAEINGEAERARLRRRIARDECGFTITDLVNGARLFGDVDEEGRVNIDVPERCQPFYNRFGEPIEEVAANDADAESDNG